MMKWLLFAGLQVWGGVFSGEGGNGKEMAEVVNGEPSDTAFRLLPGEVWWGGAANAGDQMPYGVHPFTLDLYGDVSGNQSSPLLISSKGRWIWSDQPFRYTFRHDSLLLEGLRAPLQSGQAGNSIATAYREASRRFFPANNQWPDSLLITAPQYNLWIELLYNPNQHDVMQYAHRVLENGLPPGVLMIDDNYSNYYGQFDFNKGKFPDARAMTDSLHRMGFKVMVWICPFITPDSEAFRELEARRLLLMEQKDNGQEPMLIKWWNGYSACLDLSNPAARDWLQQKLDNMQQQYGIDGFKLDAGDAYFYNNPRMVSHTPGSPNDQNYWWAQIGLRYPLNEFRAMWKMNGQPLVQRLSDKSHSWGDLRLLIPNTIAQQLMGYAFTCPDMIGGGQYGSFIDKRKLDQELIVRSAQCHALMPMMQFSAAPWRILDATHLAAVKKAVALRQQYMPYIMSVVRKAVQTGEPVVQPLEYVFPHKGYESVKDQYLLGSRLMVAPVLNPGGERKVILPEGKWQYKGKVIKGGKTINIKVALDELPVFEKING